MLTHYQKCIIPIAFKNTELKVYKSTDLPAVLVWLETWNMKYKGLETKVFKRIFAPERGQVFMRRQVEDM